MSWMAICARLIDQAGFVTSACCLIIGLVSAYDAYLTVFFSPMLPQYELNPVGRAMMQLDETYYPQLGHVARFLGMKFAGTVVVLTALQVLVFISRRWALVIAASVTGFQLLLFVFLQIGDFTG